MTPFKGERMAYWWVNHKQTRDREVRGDYLWSPKANANGARNQSYDNMARAQPGDVVFSYARGSVGAVGVVRAGATTTPKPAEFGSTGSNWSDVGWFLPVSFLDAKTGVRPKEQLGLIAPLLPTKYSPIQAATGNGNQSVYLAEIPEALGRLLLAMLDMADQATLLVDDADGDALSTQALDDIERLRQAPDLVETERTQLVQARVGQGIFRSQVLLRNPECRVTHVADKRLLRASHIKAWRDCDNRERLDGANGLMLAPHVDALFDLALMSFQDDGVMLIRRDLSMEVLRLWAIAPTHDPQPFEYDQCRYLDTHRARLAPNGAIRY